MSRVRNMVCAWLSSELGGNTEDDSDLTGRTRTRLEVTDRTGRRHNTGAGCVERRASCMRVRTNRVQRSALRQVVFSACGKRVISGR